MEIQAHVGFPLPRYLSRGPRKGLRQDGPLEPALPRDVPLLVCCVELDGPPQRGTSLSRSIAALDYALTA